MLCDSAYYIDNLTLKPDKSLLMTRLSYKHSKTQSQNELINILDAASDLAIKVSEPKAAYTLIRVEHEGKNNFKIGSIAITSPTLLEKWSECPFIALMAVTLGKNIDDTISGLFKKEEYTRAVILDAAASIIADSGIESLKNLIGGKLSGEGFKTDSFRISPGQLGIPLSAQKEFYNILSLDKIDIEINDSLMLKPQKSVISLSGVFHR